MQVRVLTLKYSEGQQGFPEEALRSATFGRDVLSVDQHFFVHDGMSSDYDDGKCAFSVKVGMLRKAC